MFGALCSLLLLLVPALHAQAEKPAARQGYTDADARFMRDMIGHHGQALLLTALVPTHTGNADLRLLAEKIDVSQQDEIASMRRWLRARGEALPDSGMHHHDMPGLLTDEEMAALGQAWGSAFDRLFLTGMIHHHEGALTMVARLFATAGAAQEPELAGFATDVDAGQRAEIRRMRALLDKVSGGGSL